MIMIWKILMASSPDAAAALAASLDGVLQLTGDQQSYRHPYAKLARFCAKKTSNLLDVRPVLK